ncbi:TIGR04222 domain-containing membrane protein [Streptomyces sp. NPDC004726]
MDLGLLAIIVYVCIGTSSVLLIARRRADRAHEVPVDRDYVVQDVYEASFLAGGPGRAVDTALATMQADGRLLFAEPGVVSVHSPVAHNPVERAVLDELLAAPSGSLSALRHAVMRSSAVQALGDRLADRGLMVPPGKQVKWSAGWEALLVVQGLMTGLLLPIGGIGITIASYTNDWDRLALPFIVVILPAEILGLIVMFTQEDRSRRVTSGGRRALRVYGARYGGETSPARRVAMKGPRGIEDRRFQALLVAAAAVAMVTTVGATASVGAETAPAWCGTSGGSGCGDSGAGGGDGGGDGGGGDGGGCGGCGGCGCGG